MVKRTSKRNGRRKGLSRWELNHILRQRPWLTFNGKREVPK